MQEERAAARARRSDNTPYEAGWLKHHGRFHRWILRCTFLVSVYTCVTGELRAQHASKEAPTSESRITEADVIDACRKGLAQRGLVLPDPVCIANQVASGWFVQVVDISSWPALHYLVECNASGTVVAVLPVHEHRVPKAHELTLDWDYALNLLKGFLVGEAKIGTVTSPEPQVATRDLPFPHRLLSREVTPSVLKDIDTLKRALLAPNMEHALIARRLLDQIRIGDPDTWVWYLFGAPSVAMKIGSRPSWRYCFRGEEWIFVFDGTGHLKGVL